MGKLNIDLLGSSFTLEAKEDSTYLESLLAYYTRVTQEIRLMSPNIDNTKVALLSGIMICDELFKDRAKAEEVKKVFEANNYIDHNKETDFSEAEKITLKMIEDIDRLLP